MVIAGTTGSGKTTLAVMLAEQSQRAVWIDLKGLNDPGWPVVQALKFPDIGVSTSAPYLAARLAEWPRITVQLSDMPGMSDLEQVDRVAHAAYKLGNVLLVLDDAMGVHTVNPPYYLNRVITMGRARGVGFLAIVQRAHRIPRVLMTEAEHLVAFELPGAEDVDRLAREANPALAAAGDLRRWHYIWYAREQRITQAFNPLRQGRKTDQAHTQLDQSA
jgi:energy-coupling factor transporter ATP-binding protein EcfA2